jgi:hypothetical protein
MVTVQTIYSVILIFTVLCLYGVDLGATVFPRLGKLGTGLWLFSYFFFFIFALKSLFTILKGGVSSLIKVRSFSGWVTPLVLFAWLYIVISNIPLAKNVSYESTQQIAQTINLLKNSPDLGFQKPCFLGYPARQFFLPALPSIVWGRNITALNTGGCLYFLLGLLIFSSGVLANFKDKTRGDIFCGILLSLLFHAYYVNYQLFYFEQSIFPFSLGLISCGLFLHFWVNPTWEVAGLLSLNLSYLVFSYTPSLALFGLSILALLYLFFKMPLPTSKRRFLILALIIGLTGFIISLKIRNDIVITPPANPTPWAEIQSKTLATGEHLLFQTRGKPIVSPVFNFVFLFGLFASLFFAYGWEMALLALWILATLILSVLSKGWAAPPPDFALHRANVVFPVFLAMGVKAAQSGRLKPRNRVYVFLFLFFFLTGIYYQAVFLKSNGFEMRQRHVELSVWAAQKLSLKSSNAMVHFYFDPSLKDQYLYWNSNDCLRYFIPNCVASLVPASPETLLQRPRQEAHFLFIPISKLTSPPYQPFREKMKYAGSFKFKTDEPLELWALP